jgi:Fe-S-cluster-containing dehydrogenase component
VGHRDKELNKWYFIIDVEKCENCNNCYLSCKDEYVNNDWPGYSLSQPEHGHKWINISVKERGQYPLIDIAYLPVPCMHCDDAPCIKAAKNGAVYKRSDGIVIIDTIKAKGQTHLINACPYSAIQWNQAKEIPQKCTLCAHLLDDGWIQTRCVQSCPTGALRILRVNDTEIKKIIEEEKLEAYLPEHKTQPRVYYKNLYRFTSGFIAGSIVINKDGIEECAEGVKVILNDVQGKKIRECNTDNYGDFKIDNLAVNGSKYSLLCTLPGFEVQIIDIEFNTSTNLGIILLQN